MSDIVIPFGKTNSNGKANGIAAPVTPMVRISGPPNSDMLVGYPGISATLVPYPPPPTVMSTKFRPLIVVL